MFSLFVEEYAQRDDRVILELAPVGAQSLLVLTHELSLPNPVDRSRIRREWAIVLDRLEALCTEGGVPYAIVPAPGRQSSAPWNSPGALLSAERR